MIKGTDLSAVQGILSDVIWQKLADAGIEFAFLRAVVGNETWTDGAAAENARRARAHGILVSPYCFSYPLPHLDPVKQAEYFVTKLEGMGMMPGELPPMNDCEWPPREEREKDGSISYPWRDKWGCSADQIRGFLEKQFDRLSQLCGMDWMIYLFPYWAQCIEIWKSQKLCSLRMNLAVYNWKDWPTDAQLAAVKPPQGVTKLTFIQNDGNGLLTLPDGRDADFDSFLGTREELVALAATRGSPLIVPNSQIPTTIEETYSDLILSKQLSNELILDSQIADYRANRIVDSSESA